jgi:hypothetical protein
LPQFRGDESSSATFEQDATTNTQQTNLDKDADFAAYPFGNRESLFLHLRTKLLPILQRVFLIKIRHSLFGFGRKSNETCNT